MNQTSIAEPVSGEPPVITRMLALLADQATEHALLLLDPQGRIIWWSKGAEGIFGLPKEQAVGRDFTEIFTPRDARAGISRLELDIAHSDAISEDDRWHMRADRSTFWSSGALVALREDNGQLLGFGKIIRDRTDLKEQVTLLENKLAAAVQSDRDKDLAISKLAHELRNLMAGIDHGLRLLHESSADAQKREMVTGLMQQQLRIIQRLIGDVLDAKRLDAGKCVLAIQNVAVQAVLRDIVEEFGTRASAKSQTLQLLCADADLTIAADVVRLHQIFSNLVDNAIKYTPSGGRIWLKATIEDEFVVVHVEDTGRGIQPEMLTRIFDLFTQVDSGSSSGLGIGLALVHELVQLHGGSVQAISKGAGLGSEFTVRLPLAPQPDSGARAP